MLTVLLLTPILFAPMSAMATAQVDDIGVTRLVGEVQFTNPSLALPEDKPFVLLNDLTAYIRRDEDYAAPVESQILGPVTGTPDAGAEFELLLPIAPEGRGHSFDGSPRSDGEVQIYSLEYMYESDGKPFVDAAEMAGWPSAVSSVQWASSGEATGGQLVVWAEVDGLAFPSGFGDDELLFTDDDPLTTLDAGWTGVDLSRREFEFSRESEYEIGIIEGDTWYYDLSDMGYVDSFNELLDTLEIRYPFTEEKGLDWEALRDEYLPLVEQAEVDNDKDAYAEVLYDLSRQFGDGHVSAQFPDSVIDDEFSGFLGLHFVETDDGELVVDQVWDDFPLGRADIEIGAEILSWNGRKPSDAIDREFRLLPASTEQGERLWTIDSLSWGKLGDEVEIEFRNPDGEEDSATLPYDYFPTLASYQFQYQYDAASGDPTVLPVTAEILPSGVGYIRVTSFYEDPMLTLAAWDLALRAFETAEIEAVVVDMRGNGGGWVSSSLQMASFVPYDDPIVFDNSAVDVETGDSVDMPFTVPENDDPYDFQVAVLIDAACMSACELFAAAVGESPNVVIVGTSASGGGVSTVSEWALPDDLVFRSSTTRTALAGEPLLEGVGVVPDIDVPITLRSAQSPDDEVLDAALEELTG